MKAVGFYRNLPIEDPESLIDLEVEKPTTSGRDLLVKVKAISVNPLDVKMRMQLHNKGVNPTILGWDAAGVVEQVGSDCLLFKPGDEVYYAGSISRPGCNSEYHLVDERIVGKKSKSINFIQAASLPLTSITAWEGLFHRLNIKMEESENTNKKILIIGSAGGVGSIATQLAKWAGLTVIGTASRTESANWSKEHGADFIIDHNDSLYEQIIKLGLDKVDYIFCLNSLERYWEQIAEVIAPQGKICTITGPEQPLDLSLLKNKSATFVWESMFTRSIYQTEDMLEQHKILNKISQLVDTEKVKPTNTERLSPINAANLRLAHKKIETGKMIGKIVLENFDTF